MSCDPAPAQPSVLLCAQIVVPFKRAETPFSVTVRHLQRGRAQQLTQESEDYQTLGYTFRSYQKAQQWQWLDETSSWLVEPSALLMHCSACFSVEPYFCC
jgi:hypothetical protein